MKKKFGILFFQKHVNFDLKKVISKQNEIFVKKYLLIFLETRIFTKTNIAGICVAPTKGIN